MKEITYVLVGVQEIKLAVTDWLISQGYAPKSEQGNMELREQPSNRLVTDAALRVEVTGTRKPNPPYEKELEYRKKLEIMTSPNFKIVRNPRDLIYNIGVVLLEKAGKKLEMTEVPDEGDVIAVLEFARLCAESWLRHLGDGLPELLGDLDETIAALRGEPCGKPDPILEMARDLRTNCGQKFEQPPREPSHQYARWEGLVALEYLRAVLQRRKLCGESGDRMSELLDKVKNNI
jgi:hypothetical protein